MLRRRDRSTTVIATGLGVDSTIARRIRIQAHLRAAGAAPRQRSAAPFFHELPTDTVPLRLPVATTARDAGRLWSCPFIPEDFAVRRAGTRVFIGSRQEISVDEEDAHRRPAFREDVSVEFSTWTLMLKALEEDE